MELKDSGADEFGVNPDSGYAYDAFGRITTTPQSAAGGTGNFQASYYVNDLARSVSQNGTTQTLDLDPKLRSSVKTKVTGTTTTTETYAYTDDSDSPAWIQTGASNWQRYVDGIDGAAGMQDQSGSAKYYFVNLRGDVVASGFPDPVESAEVDEFGVPKSDLPADRRYGFHGSKQREALTAQGMVAMGVRLYAPRTGRFLQVDPVLGGTANPYEYPSDPINESDLTGRATDRRFRFVVYMTPKRVRRLIRQLKNDQRVAERRASFNQAVGTGGATVAAALATSVATGGLAAAAALAAGGIGWMARQGEADSIAAKIDLLVDLLAESRGRGVNMVMQNKNKKKLEPTTRFFVRGKGDPRCATRITNGRGDTALDVTRC